MRTPYLGDLIDAAWLPVQNPQGTLTRFNPARRQEAVFSAPWSVAHVDLAVAAAKRALPAWDRLGFEGRLPHIERFAVALERRAEAIAVAIAAEVGKPLWEARTEAAALPAKLRLMAAQGMEFTREMQLPNQAGRAVYRPLGVLAVLGPFNFPLHLPNGQIAPALLNGATVVVKPSELSGGAMQLYFECVQEAQLPPGVINLVQGPGAVGAALAEHRDVSGVLFTGSYETGLRIKRATLEQHWKLLALEMGGKNTSIVLEDADLELTAHELLQATFLTCGQRCTATSRVVVQRRVLDELLDRFVALSQRVTTGDPLTEEVFMGPIINQAAYDRFLAAQQDDDGGRLTAVLRGATARDDLDGYFLSPGIWRASEAAHDSKRQASELFGPDVIFYAAEDEAHAVQLANATDYGLAMSLFTEDRARFDAIAPQLEAGIVNLNRTTAGASSALPFGGVKKSGNHRPAAITAGLFCTYPQAQLFHSSPLTAEARAAAPFRFLSPA